MGCGAAVVSFQYSEIQNKFGHIDGITDALRSSGMVDSQLVIGIDFSKSNIDGGAETFPWPANKQKTHTWPRPLHDVDPRKKPAKFGEKNPYEQAMTYIAQALAQFDADQLFPVYGFGDANTGSNNVFSFRQNDAPSEGLEAAVDRYREIAKIVTPA